MLTLQMQRLQRLDILPRTFSAYCEFLRPGLS